jgi:hypothetical protein
MLAKSVEEAGKTDKPNKHDERATKRNLALARAVTIACQGQVIGRLRHLHSVRDEH